MVTKKELLEEAAAAGVDVKAAAKKADIEAALDEAGVADVVVDDAATLLEGTPVEADTEYAELGVPVPDLGSPVDDAELVEGVAKDTPEAPLEASDPGEFRVDNTIVA